MKRLRALLFFASLLLVIVSAYYFRQMPPHTLVSRAWPTYTGMIAILYLIYAASAPNRRRCDPQDAIDELNDEGRYGHAFGPTVGLGTDQNTRHIRAGR